MTETRTNENKIGVIKPLIYMNTKVTKYKESNTGVGSDIILLEFPTEEITNDLTNLLNEETELITQKDFVNPCVLQVRVYNSITIEDVNLFLETIENYIKEKDVQTLEHNQISVDKNTIIKDKLIGLLVNFGFELHDNLLPLELDRQLPTFYVTEHSFTIGKSKFNNSFIKLYNEIQHNIQLNFATLNPTEYIISVFSKYGLTIPTTGNQKEVLNTSRPILENKISMLSPYNVLLNALEGYERNAITLDDLNDSIQNVITELSYNPEEIKVQEIILNVLTKFNLQVETLEVSVFTVDYVRNYFENSFARKSALHHLINQNIELVKEKQLIFTAYANLNAITAVSSQNNYHILDEYIDDIFYDEDDYDEEEEEEYL